MTKQCIQIFVENKPENVPQGQILHCQNNQWMVFVVGGKLPIVRHDSIGDARYEAIRISLLEPGKAVLVLRVEEEIVSVYEPKVTRNLFSSQFGETRP